MSSTERPTLVEAVRLENERLRDDPNVFCVGFGLRTREGEVVEEACLTYYVFEKLADAAEIEEAGSRLIPEEAHGYPTDVTVVREGRATQCPDDPGAPTGSRGTRRENPLVGGTSSTVLSDWHSFPTGYGTLGGLCFDVATGDEMALSNAHVWGEDTGRDVIQPWMPVDEYIEAGVKLLLCGGTAFIFDLVLPSPATLGLSAAAAGAWVAAAASDDEDPIRWGQRVTGAPGGGAITEREVVRLSGEVPPVPLPGRPYTAETRWDYTRITSQGDEDASVTEDRRNLHVLMGKRVWTDREEYARGTRVHICAELLTRDRRQPEDYLVVAHCFPRAEPDIVHKRVLSPGRCRERRERVWSFYGFPPPVQPGNHAPRRFRVDAFQIGLTDGTRFAGPMPSGDPDPVTSLTIPRSGVHCAVPPCTEVRVQVLHYNEPVTVEAFNAAGVAVGQAVSPDVQDAVHELGIDAAEITTLRVTGGGREGFLLGIEARQTYASEYEKKFGHLFYRGTLDLGLELDPDEWGIVLYVQTVDNSPQDVDPVVGAQNIGGIVTSSNVAVLGCAAVMLLDHVFDVI